MVQFREHRGTLIDSMETVIEVKDKQELVGIINDSLSKYGHDLDINMQTVEIKPYGFDKRINWDTHIVTLKGYGALGFTDSMI